MALLHDTYYLQVQDLLHVMNVTIYEWKCSCLAWIIGWGLGRGG